MPVIDTGDLVLSPISNLFLKLICFHPYRAVMLRKQTVEICIHSLYMFYDHTYVTIVICLESEKSSTVIIGSKNCEFMPNN